MSSDLSTCGEIFDFFENGVKHFTAASGGIADSGV